MYTNSRRLYILRVEVDTVPGPEVGGVVQIQFLPIVGFDDTGVPANMHKPMVVLPITDQRATTVDGSTVAINGNPPVPLAAFYDGEAERFVLDGTEMQRPEFIKAMRAL